MSRKLKFKSAAELKARAELYFEECRQNDEPYLITGLALALETTRKTLLDYNEKDEFKPVIKWIRLKCENWAEKNLFSGKNPAGTIFNMKNNYGWTNQDKLDVTTGGEKINGFNYITPRKDEADHQAND